MTIDAPTFVYEESIGSLAGIVAGVDEAGCGPWAGPLVVASCVLQPASLDPDLLSLIRDSKRLTPQKRELAFDHLMHSSGVFFKICCVPIEAFNQLGLRGSLDYALQDVVYQFPLPLTAVLLDGRYGPHFTLTYQYIVRGDKKSYSIAAASIIAKVTRDRLMAELHALYPEYGWIHNQGYGTKAHQEAIQKYGLTPHHRLTYKPIQAYLATTLRNTLVQTDQ